MDWDREHVDVDVEDGVERAEQAAKWFVAKDSDEPSDVLQSVAQTVESKNDDYGSAIEKNAVIKKLLAADDVVVRTDDDGTEWVQLGDHDVADLQQQRLDGIFTRLLDKVSRLYTLSFTDQTDSVGEKRRETVEDLLGYLAHAAVDGIDWDD
jgi:hypothetical protein